MLNNNLYLNLEDRLNTLSSLSFDNSIVWQCINRCRDDYVGAINPDASTREFLNWLSMTWGISITMAQDGYNLSPKFDIIADDKYTMFILKYSK